MPVVGSAAVVVGGEDVFEIGDRARNVLRRRLAPYHHDGRGTLKSIVPIQPLQQCVGVLKRAVQMGESGSLLIVGHAASGKSTLVSVALAEVAAMSHGVSPTPSCGAVFGEAESPFSLVTLFGRYLDDDLGALRSVARQLGLDNVVEATAAASMSSATEGRVLGSVADNLSFLLEALRGGQRSSTLPVVFVLDQLEAFCEAGAGGKQTLLYNLLDATQVAGTPVCVLGMTRRYDVLDMMEKRVRSRFSQRVVHLFPRHTFGQFLDISRRLLALEPEDLLRPPSPLPVAPENRKTAKGAKRPVKRTASSLPANAGLLVEEVGQFARAWSSGVEELLESDVFQTCLKSVFRQTPNFRALKSFLFCVVSRASLDSSRRPTLSNEDGHDVGGDIGGNGLGSALRTATRRAFAAATGQGGGVPDGQQCFGGGGCDLAHLPILELALLVAARRQTLLDETAPFSFSTIYREYVRFAKENPSIQLYDRSVMRKAFENLVDEGFVMAAAGTDKRHRPGERGRGVCKDYQGHRLAWGEDELSRHLKAYPSLPTALQRWISSPAVAGFYG